MSEQETGLAALPEKSSANADDSEVVQLTRAELDDLVDAAVMRGRRQRQPVSGWAFTVLELGRALIGALGKINWGKLLMGGAMLLILVEQSTDGPSGSIESILDAALQVLGGGG